MSYNFDHWRYTATFRLHAYKSPSSDGIDDSSFDEDLKIAVATSWSVSEDYYSETIGWVLISITSVLNLLLKAVFNLLFIIKSCLCCIIKYCHCYWRKLCELFTGLPTAIEPAFIIASFFIRFCVSNFFVVLSWIIANRTIYSKRQKCSEISRSNPTQKPYPLWRQVLWVQERFRQHTQLIRCQR